MFLIRLSLPVIHKKSLGQNFIYDSFILKKIVDSAKNISNCNVIEVGGGLGTLTRAILNAYPKSLTTLELDKRFCHHHAKLGQEYKNYNFINCDALKFNLDIVQNPKVIISNLPYNISTVLLLNWLRCKKKIDSLVLMFQKEVAKKIVANHNTKQYGILSVLTQLYYRTEILFDVPPSAFVPQPKVFSSVVRMVPHDNLANSDKVDLEKLKKLLKICFAQRRKIIKKSLLPAFKDKKTMQTALFKCKISETLRAENISVDQFAMLSCHI